MMANQNKSKIWTIWARMSTEIKVNHLRVMTMATIGTVTDNGKIKEIISAQIKDIIEIKGKDLNNQTIGP